MVLFSCISGNKNIYAHEEFRPQRAEQLPPGTTQEKAYRIKDARIAYANYFMLKKNYPVLQGKKNEEIDKWLLDNFAYVGEHQLKLHGIRTHFSEDLVDKNNFKTLHRPPTYNRAGCLEAEGGGIADIKGIGIYENGASEQKQLWNNNIKSIEEKIKIEKNKPEETQDKEKIDALTKELYKAISLQRTSDHSDGVMTLGEAIQEVVHQQAAQKKFNEYNLKEQNKPLLETVESLFIISIPGSVLREDGKTDRLALYGREAHLGRGRMAQGATKKFIYNPAPERFKNNSFRKINWTQTSGSGSVVDFGAILNPEYHGTHEYRDNNNKELSKEDLLNLIQGNEYLDSHKAKGYGYSFDTSKIDIHELKRSILNHIKDMTQSNELQETGDYTGVRKENNNELEAIYNRLIQKKLGKDDIKNIKKKINEVNATFTRKKEEEIYNIDSQTNYSKIYAILSALTKENINQYFSSNDQKTIKEEEEELSKFLNYSYYYQDKNTQGYQNDFPRINHLSERLLNNFFKNQNIIFNDKIINSYTTYQAPITKELVTLLNNAIKNNNKHVISLLLSNFFGEKMSTSEVILKKYKEITGNSINTDLYENKISIFDYLVKLNISNKLKPEQQNFINESIEKLPNGSELTANFLASLIMLDEKNQNPFYKKILDEAFYISKIENKNEKSNIRDRVKSLIKNSVISNKTIDITAASYIIYENCFYSKGDMILKKKCQEKGNIANIQACQNIVDESFKGIQRLYDLSKSILFEASSKEEKKGLQKINEEESKIYSKMSNLEKSYIMLMKTKKIQQKINETVEDLKKDNTQGKLLNKIQQKNTNTDIQHAFLEEAVTEISEQCKHPWGTLKKDF